MPNENEVKPAAAANPDLDFKSLTPDQVKNLSADKLVSMSEQQGTDFLNDPNLYQKVKDNLPTEEAKKALDKAITEATAFLNETPKDLDKKLEKEVPTKNLIQIGQVIINQGLMINGFTNVQSNVFAQEIMNDIDLTQINSMNVVQLQQLSISICNHVKQTCNITMNQVFVFNQLIALILIMNTIPGSVEKVEAMNPAYYELGKYSAMNPNELLALRAANGGVLGSVDATEFHAGDKSAEFYKDYSEAAKQLLVAKKMDLLDLKTKTWVDSLGGVVDAFATSGKSALKNPSDNVYKAGGLFNLLLAWQRAVDVCPQLATLAANPVSVAALSGQKIMLVQGNSVGEASARIGSRTTKVSGGVPFGVLGLSQQVIIILPDGSKRICYMGDYYNRETTIENSGNNNDNKTDVDVDIKADTTNNYYYGVNGDKIPVGPDGVPLGPESPEFQKAYKDADAAINDVNKRLMKSYKDAAEFDEFVTPSYKNARKLVEHNLMATAKNAREKYFANQLVSKLDEAEMDIISRRLELASGYKFRWKYEGAGLTTAGVGALIPGVRWIAVPVGIAVAGADLGNEAWEKHKDGKVMKKFVEANNALYTAGRLMEASYDTTENFDRSVTPAMIEVDGFVKEYGKLAAEAKSDLLLELGVSLVWKNEELKKLAAEKKGSIGKAPRVVPPGEPLTPGGAGTTPEVVPPVPVAPGESGSSDVETGTETLSEEDFEEAVRKAKESMAAVKKALKGKFEDADDFEDTVPDMYSAAEDAVLAAVLLAEKGGDSSQKLDAKRLQKSLLRLNEDVTYKRLTYTEKSDVEPDMDKAKQTGRKINQQKEIIELKGGLIKYGLMEGDEDSDPEAILEDMENIFSNMQALLSELYGYANVKPNKKERGGAKQLKATARKNIAEASKAILETKFAVKKAEEGVLPELKKKYKPYDKSKEDEYADTLMANLEKGKYDFQGWSFWGEEGDSRGLFVEELLKICEAENIAPFEVHQIKFYDKENDKMYDFGKKEAGTLGTGKGDVSFGEDADEPENVAFLNEIHSWIKASKGMGGKFEYLKV